MNGGCGFPHPGERGDRLLQISPEEQEAGHRQELRRHHLGPKLAKPKSQRIPDLESPRRNGGLGAYLVEILWRPQN